MAGRYISIEMSTYEPATSSQNTNQIPRETTSTKFSTYKISVPWFRTNIQLAATWRGTATIGIIVAGAAFLLNLAVLIWALVTLPKRNGFAVAFSGSESEAHAIELGIKLVINVVSTLILISSCRCTQFLCAPTREDVDRCHVRGQWLDIGIRSFRNFRVIRGWRRWLNVVLFTTSIPIHLIDYVAVTVDSSFASGLSWNASVVLPKLNDTNREDLYNIALSLQEKAIAGNLVAMDNGTCHSLYSKGAANTKWGNVLLVSPELNQTSGEAGNTSTVAAFFPGLVPSPGKYHTYAWDVNYEFNVWDAAWDLASTWQAPAADCILDDSILCASNTSFSAVPVGECLIDEVPEMCTVSINIAFLIVVIVSTALKAGSLILGRRKDDFAPLTTTGDAMASFIITPDPCTAGLGPLSVLEIPKDGLRSDSTAAACSIYGRQYRWFQAPAKWRWYIGTLSMLIPLGLGGFCLYWSLTGTMGTGFFTNAPTNNPNLVVESTGLLSGPSIITFAHSFAGMAFTVNAVQLLLSSIYFCVNDLLTSMTLAHEYHSYAVQRKPLRVTRSQGLQRSTYFLSMPNKYAIPLVAVWTLLHWAIAASLSLTRVDVYTHDGILDEARSYTGMVVSSDWLWEVWAASLFVVISLVLLGVRKLKKGVPLTRSCSLAISAACHRSPQEGSNMVFLPLQYGVLTDIGNAKHDGLQCVGFSAQDVMPLDPGCSYTSYSHSDIGEPFSEGATNFYSDAVK